MKPGASTKKSRSKATSPEDEVTSPPPEDDGDEEAPKPRAKAPEKTDKKKTKTTTSGQPSKKQDTSLFEVDDFFGSSGSSGSSRVAKVTAQVGDMSFNPRDEDDDDDWQPFTDASSQASIKPTATTTTKPAPKVTSAQTKSPDFPLFDTAPLPKPVSTSVLPNVFDMSGDDDEFTDFQAAPTKPEVKQQPKQAPATTTTTTTKSSTTPATVPKKPSDTAWDTPLVDLDLGRSIKKPDPNIMSLSSRASASFPTASPSSNVFGDFPGLGFDSRSAPIPSLPPGPSFPPTGVPPGYPGYPGFGFPPSGYPAPPTSYPSFPSYPGYPPMGVSGYPPKGSKPIL